MNMPSLIVPGSLRAAPRRGPADAMETPQTIDWDEQEFAEVRPGIFGATVHTPQLTATLYRYAAGSSWETHAHPQDQMTYVLAGAIDFVVDGRPVRLSAGQLAALPGGVPHSASVGEAAGAVSLNVFTSRERPPDP
jgi:quercetin dioxygenase-like cupin family protein